MNIRSLSGWLSVAVTGLLARGRGALVLVVCTLFANGRICGQSTTVQSVDSVAALKALPIPKGGSGVAKVEVSGYYAANDGGGGAFYWDPGCNYFQATDVSMQSGGAGYAVHDVLLLHGGTLAEAYDSTVMIDVLAVDDNGAVRTWAVMPGNRYAVLPDGPQTTAITGVYVPGTPAHSPGGATFTVTNSLPDDGCMWINPTGYTGTGRWRRTVRADEPLNPLWAGARIVVGNAGAWDSLPAINTVIAALPNADYGPQEYPGAGHTGHTKAGTIFIPAAIRFNKLYQGFFCGDEIFLSAKMALVGEGSDSLLGFLPGVANDAAHEKFVVRVVPAGSPNETFFTRLRGLCISPQGDSNAGASGIYFVGCNGAELSDLDIGAAALRGYVIESAGVEAHNLRVNDNVRRGPGLQVMGAQFTATGYLDIEHVNSANTISGPGGLPVHIDPGDGHGDPYPAVEIRGAGGVIISQLTTEQSSLSLKLVNSPNVYVGNISDNTDPVLTNGIAHSAFVRAYGSDHVTINGMNEQSPAARHEHYVVDQNSGFGDATYDGDGIGARGSYVQIGHFNRLTLATAPMLPGLSIQEGGTVDPAKGYTSFHAATDHSLHAFDGVSTDHVIPWLDGVDLTLPGSLRVLGVKNGSAGTSIALHRLVSAVLSSGRATISDPAITASSICTPTNQLFGYTGAVGYPYVSAQSAGQVIVTSSNPAATNTVFVTIEN